MSKFLAFNTVTAASYILVGALLSTASMAKDNKEIVITFDDGILYQNCILQGGTFKDNGSTYSCTIGNTTTTCDKKPADKDASCSTEIRSPKASFSKPVLDQSSAQKNTQSKQTSRSGKFKSKFQNHLVMK